MTDDEPKKQKDIPALFATIHHQSDDRPDGYTANDIADLNRLANGSDSNPRKKTVRLANAVKPRSPK